MMLGRRRRCCKQLLVLCCGMIALGFVVLIRSGQQDKQQLLQRAERWEPGAGGDSVAAGESEYERLQRTVYEKPPLDESALGELGRAVHLNLEGDEKRKEEESVSKHQINIYVSDRISLRRRLPERWNP
eukprot:g25504.t1